MDDRAEGRFFHALLQIGRNFMLKEYAWRDSTWQFDESEAPVGSVELTAAHEEPEPDPETEPEPEPEPDPETEAKAKKPANKSRAPRNKADGND